MREARDMRPFTTLGAETEDISRVPAPAAVAALMALARRSVAMRHWEREHLPIHASQLGFELFMTLPQLFTAGIRDRTGLLKQLYLMLPYSEKGVRLHLRRLEMAGWIAFGKTGSDTRSTQVELSPAYWRLLGVYAAHCQLIGGSGAGVERVEASWAAQPRSHSDMWS